MQQQIRELEEYKHKKEEERARFETQVKVQHQAQLKEARHKLKVKHEQKINLIDEHNQKLIQRLKNYEDTFANERQQDAQIL